ncbi:MAG: hypothetical protein FWD77_08330 [Betaproteobacteria bacterium]|nr:hypothetical protein [Betaproteobacteria bacterium]
MKAFIALLLAFIAFPASAQELPTIFGIEFGKPLQVPECPYSKKTRPPKYDWGALKDKRCWQHIGGALPGTALKSNDAIALLMTGENFDAAITQRPMMFLNLEHEVVVAAVLYTDRSLSRRTRTILEEKFGKPFSAGEGEKTLWGNKDYAVFFDEYGSLESGRIHIYSRAWMERMTKEEKSKQTPF